MRRVSSHTYLNRQVTALRSTALTLLHRKAVFEYLQERERMTLVKRDLEFADSALTLGFVKAFLK